VKEPEWLLSAAGEQCACCVKHASPCMLGRMMRKCKQALCSVPCCQHSGPVVLLLTSIPELPVDTLLHCACCCEVPGRHHCRTRSRHTAVTPVQQEAVLQKHSFLPILWLGHMRHLHNSCLEGSSSTVPEGNALSFCGAVARMPTHPLSSRRGPVWH
jgi:hypothetical protein